VGTQDPQERVVGRDAHKKERGERRKKVEEEKEKSTYTKNTLREFFRPLPREVGTQDPQERVVGGEGKRGKKSRRKKEEKEKSIYAKNTLHEFFRPLP
jgi:hypothetical protein